MDNTSSVENETVIEAQPAKSGLTAKGVKRRMARISGNADPKKARRQTNRLAMNLLERIASGEVKNPKAVAKAFIAGKPFPPETVEEGAD